MENWNDVYFDLGEELIKFYNKHGSNTGKDLYQLFVKNVKFRNTNTWILKFYPVFKVRSLDPIHVFASINSNKLAPKKRIERINLLFYLLTGRQNKYNEIDFIGCPSPPTINLISARKEEEQDEIWKVFANIKFNRRNLNQIVFENLKKWFGVDIYSFTIFLYWTDASNFLPLDKHTISLLLNTKKINTIPKSFSSYQKLIPFKNTFVYKEIATLAYNFQSKGNKKIKFSRDTELYLGNFKSEQIPKYDFKIIGIKTKSSKHNKALTVDKFYRLYAAYDLINEYTVSYNPNCDINIYNTEELNINISAIVGKNGSGKSTIIELILMAINNLCYENLKNKKQQHLEYVDGVNLDLYILTNTVYKITIVNKTILINEYEFDGKTYNQKKAPINKHSFLKNNFFFSIIINYSHYSLNSDYIGNWINSLFHKNDGYQTPVVINPKRNNGNIDINSEEKLLATRLLFMFLMQIADGENIEDSLRSVAKTDNTFKIAYTLNLNLKEIKINSRAKKLKSEITDQIRVLNIVFDEFGINKALINSTDNVIVAANDYIYKKLIKIPYTYKIYNEFINESSERLKYIDRYANALKKDTSHIAFKIKQVINFLKYSLLDKKEKQNIKIDELANKIHGLRKDEPSLKLMELLPPPIFDVNFILKDDKGRISDFRDLSSGEKQYIHSNSILIYHLLNIDSVLDNKELIPYRSVNIIFDEIELYYHPELQRRFISQLRNTLVKVSSYLEKIKEINFCFVTHSPFILSDIPKNNILFLNEESENLKETFAANIHDLLATSFFLKNGFIGEFSKQKIQNVIDLLQKDAKNVNSEELLNIINLIGESFLKEKLLEMFDDKFENTLSKENEIKKLKDRLTKLEA